MHPTNFFNTNSELKIKIITLKSILKNIATYALPRTSIGNPHTNVFVNVLASGRMPRSLNIVAKRWIELFEKLFYLKNIIQ